MFNQGTSVYMIYFDNQTETYNYATRSTGGTWTTTVIGTGETHTGTKAFNSNYYSLPDAAGYDANANRLYLFYMNSTTHKVDEWSGTGSTWTKTTGIISTGTVPYADSITSFVQASTPSTGAIFYISGSGSPFNLNAATLTFATNSTTGNFQAIISAQNGFTGTVNLTTAITPGTGLTVTCNPSTITGGSGVSNCLVNSTVPGNYTVTVTGTSGSLNHSTTVAVNAPGAGPDFTITATTPTPANAGASTSSTITITATGGFTGTVTLTDTVPSGLTCNPITPGTITGSGTATLTCHASVAANYTVTITGTSGSLVHSATATFRIQDFTISSTNSITVNAGSSGTTTATIAALNGFGGTVSLTDTVPTGLTCGSITPSSITGSGSSTIACSANQAGNYTLTITGTSASLVHTSATLFIIQNFTITATSPSPVNVSQSAVSTITITAQ
ncbi:MAG TPA: hypothetical protein VFV92_02845, partial [Candidatus Bathyarchaeia archaeon]|nr:hypothetical protein [Candidatus Bathyarchaeia archaeon]